MQSLPWFSIPGLSLILILTACAPSTPAPLAIPPTPRLTLAPTVSIPTSTLIPTPEPVGLGVPVIEYVGGQSELRIVSSITGKPFDEFSSIDLEYYDNYVYSPDGKTLAVISNAQLYLIDLPSWNFRQMDIDLHGPVYSAVYSPDGTLLAFASGSSGRDLQVLDARNGNLQASTQTDFSIRNLKFTIDGKSLMVYGPQFASTGVAASAEVSVGAPKAALYAIPDLRLIWSVELNGIRDGTFPKEAGTGNPPDIYQPGAAWHFQPGIAFAPKDDFLYLVHGDQDKLTTVDFTARHVKTIDLQVKTSWLDRLLALTAGVAHAKGMDGTTKQAVIAPDGRFLFVVGNTETVTPQADGTDWDVTDTSIGLQIINPQDGTLLDKIDTAASLVRLSPADGQLLLIGWHHQGGPFTDVYNISSRSVIKHLDGMYLIPTRRLDGKAILASSDFLNGYETHVTLLDPQTWATTSQWTSKGDVGWLIDP